MVTPPQEPAPSQPSPLPSNTPETKPLDPIRSNSEDLIMKALDFARNTASAEAQFIERLHTRTLKALTILVSVLFLVGAGFSFIGYQNLKNMAINTARQAMQDEIKKRVAAEATPEKIQENVRDVLKGETGQTLKTSVDNEVRAKTLPIVKKEIEALKPQIELIARQETSRTVSTLQPTIKTVAINETRRIVDSNITGFNTFGLTPEQQDKFRQILRSKGPHSVAIRCGKNEIVGNTPTNAVQKLFESAGWFSKWDFNQPATIFKFQSSQDAMLTLVSNDDISPDVQALKKSFDEMGLKYRVVSDNPNSRVMFPQSKIDPKTPVLINPF